MTNSSELMTKNTYIILDKDKDKYNDKNVS